MEVATTALITLFSCCGGAVPGNESGLAALRLLLLVLLGAGAAFLGEALLVGAAGVTVGAAVSLVRAADGLLRRGEIVG